LRERRERAANVARSHELDDSYEYVTAAALVEPQVRIGTFTDEVRHSPEMVSAPERITVRENSNIPHDKRSTWARVIVRTTDGRVFEEVSEKFEGAIGRPMGARTACEQRGPARDESNDQSPVSGDCQAPKGTARARSRSANLVGGVR
jgi:2-methylcitrate dehydratase PrpD